LSTGLYLLISEPDILMQALLIVQDLKHIFDEKNENCETASFLSAGTGGQCPMNLLVAGASL